MPKVLMVDPPSGWKYGFPKPMPKNGITLEEFLKEANYPKDLISLALKNTRYWEEEVEETTVW